MSKAENNEKKITLDEMFFVVQPIPLPYRMYDGKVEFLNDTDRLSKTMQITAYREKDKSKVAIMELVLFDIDYVGDYDGSVPYEMDEISAEYGNLGLSLYAYCTSGYTSDYFDKIRDSNMINLYDATKFVDVYMRTLFVYPEYRHCGIGTHLLTNIPELLFSLSKIIVRMVTTIPDPIDYTTEDYKCTKDEEMKKIMIKHIMNHGFVPIDETQIVFINDKKEYWSNIPSINRRELNDW